MKDFDLKSHALGLVLKTIGVEPSLSGLITAAGGKPDEVFKALDLTVEMAPKVITAVMEMDARMKRVEQMLQLLCAERANHHTPNTEANQVGHQLPPEVTQALLAAAGA